MKKVLIIGAGRIAGLNEEDNYRAKPCTHVGAYQEHDAFEVVGICDKDKQSAQYFSRLFGIQGIYDNIPDALAETKPDVVSIAIPYQFNIDVVYSVADNPYRPSIIFCEKPIANSLKSAELMINVCKKNNVLFYINNRRLTPVYKEFSRLYKQVLNSSGIVTNAWCSSGLHAVGIHLIDLLRDVFGEIAWVRALGESERVEQLPYSANYTPDDPRVNSQIGFKSGLIGNFTNTALTSFTYFEIEVLCRSGKLRISDNGNRLQLFECTEPGGSTLSYRLKDPSDINIKNSITLFASIVDCLAYADCDSVDHPLSAIHGLLSYKILDAMVRSANNRKTVFL